MPHVDRHCHEVLESLVREKLAKAGFEVLPAFTYHEVFGGDSLPSWALRKATGAIAQKIRSLPDIIAIIHKLAYSFDCKTNDSHKYRSASFEALPLLNYIHQAPNESIYLYKDCIDQSIGHKAVLLNKQLATPKIIFLTGKDKQADRQVTKLAIAIWAEVTFANCHNPNGSGDAFIVFDEATVRSWPNPAVLIGQLARGQS